MKAKAKAKGKGKGKATSSTATVTAAAAAATTVTAGPVVTLRSDYYDDGGGGGGGYGGGGGGGDGGGVAADGADGGAVEVWYQLVEGPLSAWEPLGDEDSVKLNGRAALTAKGLKEAIVSSRGAAATFHVADLCVFGAGGVQILGRELLPDVTATYMVQLPTASSSSSSHNDYRTMGVAAGDARAATAVQSIVGGVYDDSDDSDHSDERASRAYADLDTDTGVDSVDRGSYSSSDRYDDGGYSYTDGSSGIDEQHDVNATRFRDRKRSSLTLETVEDAENYADKAMAKELAKLMLIAKNASGEHASPSPPPYESEDGETLDDDDEEEEYAEYSVEEASADTVDKHDGGDEDYEQEDQSAEAMLANLLAIAMQASGSAHDEHSSPPPPPPDDGPPTDDDGDNNGHEDDRDRRYAAASAAAVHLQSCTDLNLVQTRKRPQPPAWLLESTTTTTAAAAAAAAAAKSPPFTAPESSVPATPPPSQPAVAAAAPTAYTNVRVVEPTPVRGDEDTYDGFNNLTSPGGGKIAEYASPGKTVVGRMDLEEAMAMARVRKEDFVCLRTLVVVLH